MRTERNMGTTAGDAHTTDHINTTGGIATTITAAASKGATRPGSRRIEVLVDGVPIIGFEPLPGRVATSLVVPGIGRIVDVSVQPGALTGLLDQTSADSQLVHEVLETEVRDAVGAASAHANCWSPSRSLPLTAVFGGIAFPLLGAAYDVAEPHGDIAPSDVGDPRDAIHLPDTVRPVDGVDTTDRCTMSERLVPLDQIPRWAEPILASSTIGRGAEVAFGRKATRPVRRALVDALRPAVDGSIDLAVLALALIGRHVLQPDRIARVLSSTRQTHPYSDLPDMSTLTTAGRIVTEWGAQRCERILVDAVGRPDGLGMLLRTVVYAEQLGADGPRGRLPNRLDALHDVHRVLMRSAPDPVPTPGYPLAHPGRCTATDAAMETPAAGPRSATASDRQSRTPAFPHPVLAVQRVATRRPNDLLMPLNHPPSLRALDGHRTGDLMFVLPRTTGDLQRWGRLLSNCLESFRPNGATPRCSIIGIERNRRLTYAVEIKDGVIRQFNGKANRIPAIHDRAPTLRALVEAGAMDPSNGHNRRWLAAAGIGR